MEKMWRICHNAIPILAGFRWMFPDPDLLQVVWLFHLRSGKTFHHFLALRLHWVSKCGFLMRPSFPIRQCLRPQCLLSRFSPRTKQNRGIFLVRLCCRTYAVTTSLGRKRVMFDHRAKRSYWSFEWFAESPVTQCFLIRQQILFVSQKAAALHGIRPPFFIETRFPSLILRTALIVTTELPDFVRRKQIDDCFEIHILHRILWSAVIKTPTFSARCTAVLVRFLQGTLVI